MTPREVANEVFAKWHDGLRKVSRGLPAKGTLSGALVVLERLKEEYLLHIDDHTAGGGSQIVGASGSRTADLLSQFGEVRPFSSEGGRTNRGLRGDIASLLKILKKYRLDEWSRADRRKVLVGLQRHVVEVIQAYFNLQRLAFHYDPAKSTWQCVRDLMVEAEDVGKDGPVAEYLVGAKLALRFPDEEVRNSSYSTSDVQHGQHGDFTLGSTVFHVTVAPGQLVVDKCKRNLEHGYRVYLLVPERSVIAAKQLADLAAPGRIAVESVETFVAQNIDELSVFSQERLRSQFRSLLEQYNRRVNDVELDKSLLIEIPANL